MQAFALLGSWLTRFLISCFLSVIQAKIGFGLERREVWSNYVEEQQELGPSSG